MICTVKGFIHGAMVVATPVNGLTTPWHPRGRCGGPMVGRILRLFFFVGVKKEGTVEVLKGGQVLLQRHMGVLYSLIYVLIYFFVL